MPRLRIDPPQFGKPQPRQIFETQILQRIAEPDKAEQTKEEDAAVCCSESGLRIAAQAGVEGSGTQCKDHERIYCDYISSGSRRAAGDFRCARKWDLATCQSLPQRTYRAR